LAADETWFARNRSAIRKTFIHIAVSGDSYLFDRDFGRLFSFGLGDPFPEVFYSSQFTVTEAAYAAIVELIKVFLVAFPLTR
jgi:hypothetical protein